ncbi:hypothetical protein N657DRAFT_419080 [Parathielavia appendiculata]|uniref:Uncharacterized protein n=1 Tax=Parathielavia appendiculata TaxID=2587402 RepID=A0AAN6TZH9_9PEZI|nr:hypothetical protein N657DRAFT_419080 [Parathielavia appendiculata]
MAEAGWVKVQVVLTIGGRWIWWTKAFAALGLLVGAQAGKNESKSLDGEPDWSSGERSQRVRNLTWKVQYGQGSEHRAAASKQMKKQHKGKGSSQASLSHAHLAHVPTGCKGWMDDGAGAAGINGRGLETSVLGLSPNSPTATPYYPPLADSPADLYSALKNCGVACQKPCTADVSRRTLLNSYCVSDDQAGAVLGFQLPFWLWLPTENADSDWAIPSFVSWISALHPRLVGMACA